MTILDRALPRARQEQVMVHPKQTAADRVRAVLDVARDAVTDDMTLQREAA
ncbi:hypothetical protein GJ689_24815 [Rhodoplanes serenus]|uniref:Uncharacterized protein n=1 Tax=Rhodoplanes serenus TaxID=200615 RepID=A0A9X4XRC0_9BRAD|nr:hypothetical protein [Rhodoplanes serenus]MTW19417.1 hypothetical protein [Rhodoplanes serenus]